MFSCACVLFSLKLLVYVQIFAQLFISLMCICWINESRWFGVNDTMKKLKGYFKYSFICQLNKNHVLYYTTFKISDQIELFFSLWKFNFFNGKLNVQIRRLKITWLLESTFLIFIPLITKLRKTNSFKIGKKFKINIKKKCLGKKKSLLIWKLSFGSFWFL